MKSKDKKIEEATKKEIKKFNNSVKYSIEGLIACYRDERSMLIHLVMSIVVIVCGIIFKITTLDWVLSLIMMGTIMCIEILNTAIESCVDLVTLEKHPEAKKAKDCGSAAAFMMSIFTFIGELVIFLPHIQNFFMK